MYTPDLYDNIIKTAKKSVPLFEVKRVKNGDIINFKNWWPMFFKETTKNIEKKGEKFCISKYRQLLYKSKDYGCVKAYDFTDGLQKVIFKLSKNTQTPLVFPEDKAYNGKYAVKPQKTENISKVKH